MGPLVSENREARQQIIIGNDPYPDVYQNSF